MRQHIYSTMLKNTSKLQLPICYNLHKISKFLGTLIHTKVVVL